MKMKTIQFGKKKFKARIFVPTSEESNGAKQVEAVPNGQKCIKCSSFVVHDPLISFRLNIAFFGAGRSNK